MMDLPCRFVVVDVVSVLGTEQNVSKNVGKYDVSGEGVRQRFQGRSREQHDIELFDPDIGMSIEELHENGEDAISLDSQTLEFAKHKHEYLFVDFFASCKWCIHTQIGGHEITLCLLTLCFYFFRVLSLPRPGSYSK